MKVPVAMRRALCLTPFLRRDLTLRICLLMTTASDREDCEPRPDGNDNRRAKAQVLNVLSVFLLVLQMAYKLSDAATNVLLKFVCFLVNLLGKVTGCKVL